MCYAGFSVLILALFIPFKHNMGFWLELAHLAMSSGVLELPYNIYKPSTLLFIHIRIDCMMFLYNVSYALELDVFC